MRISLALALIASVIGSPLCERASASTITGPTVEVLASRLVELTFPTEMIRRDAKKSYEASLRATVLQNPQSQAAVDRMPGLLNAIVNAGSLKLDQTIVALCSTLKTDATNAYAAGLTSDELNQAVIFYSSSAGKNLVTATPAIAAGGNVREILSPSDLAHFAAFSQSSAGRKTGELNLQQVSKIGIAISRALHSAQPEIDAAAMQAGQAYMRTHQPKRR